MCLCVCLCVLGVPLLVFYYALYEQVCLLIYFMLLTRACVYLLEIHFASASIYFCTFLFVWGFSGIFIYF